MHRTQIRPRTSHTTSVPNEKIKEFLEPQTMVKLTDEDLAADLVKPITMFEVREIIDKLKRTNHKESMDCLVNITRHL